MGENQMRNLMRIVEGFITESSLDADILTEATNYDDLFSSLRKSVQKIEDENLRSLFLKEITEFANEQIAWAKSNLKKNDRVVWFLRIVKVSAPRIVTKRAMASLGDGVWEFRDDISDNDRKVVDDFIGSELEAYNRRTKGGKISAASITGSGLSPVRGADRNQGEQVINRLKETLTHFIGLKIASIDRIVWEWQSPSELISQFEEEEDLWKSERKGLIPFDPEDGKPVIKFGDGMMWVLLPRGYCKVEGDAMGHCGNVSGSKGDRILSLRKLIEKGKDKFYEPSLTFILDNDGKLGEMKGRGNEKPSKKYHPYIVSLLKDDIVKGIKGGGYLPQNNFSINDLDPADANEIIDKKPELATYLIRFQRDGLTKNLAEEIVSYLRKNGTKGHFLEDASGFVLEQCGRSFAWWDDFESFINVKGTGRASDLFSQINGDEPIEIQSGTDESARYFFDLLSRHERAAIVSYIEKEHADELEDSEVDLDSDDELLNFLNEHDDSLYSAFWVAYEAGVVTGTENEIIKVFKREVSDLKLRYGSYLTFGGNPRQMSLSGKVEIVVPTEELMALVDDQENGVDEIESIFYDLELDVPDNRYGYEGFDDSAAKERFAEDYPQIMHAAKERKESEKAARLSR